MSISLTTEVLKITELSQPEKHVLTVLCFLSNESHEVYRSIERLSIDCSFSIKTIERVLKKLRENHYLLYTGRKAPKSTNIPIYKINLNHGLSGGDLDLTTESQGVVIRQNITCTKINHGLSVLLTTPPQSVRIDNKIKDNKNNININARENSPTEEDRQETNKQKITRTLQGDLLQLPPPEIFEEKNVVNPDYEYQETLYPMPTIAEQTSTKQLELRQQYNLTPYHENTFEQFWELYPKKYQKNRVKQLWFAQGCHLNAEAILTKLKLQSLNDSAFLEGFAPSAQNYLLDQRWEDEIYVKPKARGHFNYDSREWAKKPAPEDDIFGDFQ